MAMRCASAPLWAPATRTVSTPVADLAERGAVRALGVLIAALATNDELALVDRGGGEAVEYACFTQRASSKPTRT